MQVKKFEAKSMKEALEMVKIHLGPEAIILSAKDSHRGFGLMGEKSVEVTAAVSEETLRKKRVAESKLREDLKARFQQIPAAKQREFINRVFKDSGVSGREMVAANGEAMRAAANQRVSVESRAQTSGMRYIDIQDDEQPQAKMSQREIAAERVRRAAERARQASSAVLQDPPRKTAAPKRATSNQDSLARVVPQMVSQVQAANSRASSQEMEALQSQVRELKSLIERFQQVPQMPMSLHPGAEQGLPFELSPVYQRLTQQGIQPVAVTQMLKRAQKELDSESLKRSPLVEAWIVRQLLNTIEVSKDPTGGRYHVFMGATGQGKTSTLIKLASQLVLKQKKTIAIVSLDTFKVGAAEQLRIYAQILNVPFAIVRTPEEWRIAEQRLKGVAHILVDCPGFSLRTMEEVDWLKSMLPPAEFGRSVHYVQSALARDEEAFDLASRRHSIQASARTLRRCKTSSFASRRYRSHRSKFDVCNAGWKGTSQNLVFEVFNLFTNARLSPVDRGVSSTTICRSLRVLRRPKPKRSD